MDPLMESDPRQLGPYKIIARLGSGGMGVVFLGSKGSQRVAVKVMRSSFLDSPALRTRFEREIATLKKIKSPLVAQYLDSEIEGELVWHAVEFVNGPTLKERIESDGPLNEEAWWALYSQMREVLNDVHQAGVVHRDLKPANIILSETGVKLIDFGISQDSDATSLTSTGMVAGSPAWLSPEQLEGTEVGPGSDLFSAGSILVYAALGRSPWGSETTMTVPVAYKKILSLDFDFDGLPSAYRNAVSSLLLEEASERSFSEISLTGTNNNQNTPDEPEKPLVIDEQRDPETRLPGASEESKTNAKTKVRIVAGFMVAVILGAATLLFLANSSSSISQMLDNGNNLATVSKPQTTPVFAGDLWEIHWRSGETYGLSPKTLFADYYTAFASDVILIREDCGSGPDGGFQENEQVMVKFDSGWVSVSEPTLSNGACPGGQPLRTYTAELSELQDLVPGNECVPIRFTNTADRGAPDLYEEWCVSFPESPSQLDEIESSEGAANRESAESCDPPSLKEDFEISESRGTGPTVQLTLELTTDPLDCWGDIVQVFADIQDNRIPDPSYLGFFGGPWAPLECSKGFFQGIEEGTYGTDRARYVFQEESSDPLTRFSLTCIDSQGNLDPWPLSISYGVQFSEIDYPNRTRSYAELDDYRPGDA